MTIDRYEKDFEGHVATTDAIAHTIASENFFNPPCAGIITAEFVAQDSAGHIGGMQVTALLKCIGTPAVLTVTDASVIYKKGDAALSGVTVGAVANQNTGNVDFTVTGLATTTIDWGITGRSTCIGPV
jgi:hypothetical protein